MKRMKKAICIFLGIILCIPFLTCGCDANVDKPDKDNSDIEQKESAATKPKDKSSIIGAWGLVDNDAGEVPGVMIFYDDNTYHFLYPGEARVWNFYKLEYQIKDEEHLERSYITYSAETSYVKYVTEEYSINGNTMKYQGATYQRISSDRYKGSTLIGTWYGYENNEFRLSITNDVSGITGHSITFYNDGSYNLLYNGNDWSGDYTKKYYGFYNVINGGTALRITQDHSEEILAIENLGFGLLLLEYTRDRLNGSYWYLLCI